MLIEDFTLEYLDSTRVRAFWTGTLAYVAWIFVNGLLKEGPVSYDGTERSVDLTVPNPYRLEIHEAPVEISIDRAIGDPLERRPTIWWSPRANAQRYNVYHRPKAGDTVRILSSVPQDVDASHFEFRPIADLRGDGGLWNFLRIEAVNARGAESVRAEFPFFVAGLPELPVSLTPSGGGGVFDLALGLT